MDGEKDNRYVFSVRRYMDKTIFNVDRAMTDTELDSLSPAIVKDIFWKMVEQTMEIKP